MARRKSNSDRNENILYLTVWVVIAVLPVVLELWELINNHGFTWKFVHRWWTGMIPLAVIFLIHNYLLIPKLMKRGRMKGYCLSLLVILSLYGGLQQVAVQQMRREFRERIMEQRQRFEMNDAPPIRPEPAPEIRPDRAPEIRPQGPSNPMDRPPRMLFFPLLFKIMLAAMTLGINVAISLSFTYSREQAKREELLKNRLQEELKYLKQQISPHFLMNVLNNIHEMTEENIKEAQDMILELSYLMRYVLYESENDMTTLAAESRFIASYVALMKRRYVEGIVKVSLDIHNKSSENINIPPLLFISFIENAFKHGVSYNNETHIDIKLNEENGRIKFICDNTIPQKKPVAKEGGVGLSNVRRRLDLLYGEDYSLCINQDDRTHSVELIIPSR